MMIVLKESPETYITTILTIIATAVKNNLFKNLFRLILKNVGSWFWVLTVVTMYGKCDTRVILLSLTKFGSASRLNQ